jgi:hypothetical protein
MSGEFFSGETHDTINLDSLTNPGSMDDGKVETDVDGVFADGKKDGFPIFNVDRDDFFTNMKAERKRLRFKPETPASGYLRGSKYNKPFYVQYKGDDGHFLRKVK